MELPSHIATLLKSLAQFDSDVAADEQAHRLQFECDTKSVKVLWPKHSTEIFLDFTKGGELLLAESVEYYENETGPEQAQDIALIAQNFLLNEVKVADSGTFLKRRELQSFRSGQWLSVFETAAQ